MDTVNSWIDETLFIIDKSLILGRLTRLSSFFYNLKMCLFSYSDWYFKRNFGNLNIPTLKTLQVYSIATERMDHTLIDVSKSKLITKMKNVP